MSLSVWREGLGKLWGLPKVLFQVKENIWQSASESSNRKTKQETVHIGTPKLQIIHPLVGHLLIYTYLSRAEEKWRLERVIVL